MKRVGIPLVMGLVLSLVVLALMALGAPFLDLMELKAQDALFLARGPRPAASGAVAVVAVDEQSLDQEGRWPWPREKTARLIRAVATQGAKVIGLDMGFFEPDNRLAVKSVVEILEAARQGRPPALEEVITRFHPDYLLAKAIAEAPCDVVIGYFFHMNQREVGHLGPAEAKKRRRQLAKFAFPVVRFASPEAMDRPLLQAWLPEPNQPLITAAARWAGFFNIIPDRDGVVRRQPLLLQMGDAYYPSLVLATLARYKGLPLPRLNIQEHGLDGVVLGDVFIPTDHLGRLRINYLGGETVIPTVSAGDLLAGRRLGTSLKGKAVLISVTATGVFDLSPTPLDPRLPGCYIHAQAMDNVLARDFMVRTAWTTVVDATAVLVLGLGTALALALLPPLAGGGLALLMGAGYVGLGYALFMEGYLLDLVHPLLALLAVGVAVTLYRYLGEERQRRFVKRAFQYYLSPEVIDAMLADPGGLKLGGSKQDLSVLFADIRGFTSLAEKLEPELLAQVLNLFLDRVTQVILAHGGLLGKYIGDAVMAVFGAPVAQPDHAGRACAAALDLGRLYRELLPEWERRGVPPLALGVGVNSGPMVVGNMGSSLRFDYTVIGDNVNLASRLEGQTRVYGVDSVVSQATRDLCAGDFHFRVLDLIRVKGRQEPVRIYEILGPAQGPEPELAVLMAEALERYLARDFGGALAVLERLSARHPGDVPARLLAERCTRFLKEPPAPDWDGVETKTSK